MPDAHSIFLGFVIPLAVAAAIMFVFRRAWAAAIAAGLAYTVGHWQLVGIPGFPPLDNFHWLFFTAVVATIVGVIESSAKMSWWLVALLRLLAVGGLADVLLSPLPDALPVAGALVWAASITLIGAAVWAETSRASAKLTGATPAAVWLLVIGAATLAVGFTGSIKLLQLGGALVAGLIPVVIFAATRPNRPIARGICAISTLILVGLLTMGRFYSALPDYVALILLLSPLWILLASVLDHIRKRSRAAAAVTLILTAVPLLIIVTSLAVAFFNDVE
jgi:Protein of unknown function (DUF2484)